MIGAKWTDWTRSPANAGGSNAQSVSVQLSEGIGEHCERAGRPARSSPKSRRIRFYGDRNSRAVDPESHRWTFTMRIRDVTTAEASIGQPITAQGLEVSEPAQAEPTIDDTPAALADPVRRRIVELLAQEPMRRPHP